MHRSDHRDCDHAPAAETVRPRRRFPTIFRARPSSLALTSIGLVAAAILGVQLGQSTISQINPIHFIFDVSESDYLRYQRLYLSGARPQVGSPTIPVRIRLADETDWSRTGKIDFVDNILSPRSGTIRTRAIVDNLDRLLTPAIMWGDYTRNLAERYFPGHGEGDSIRPVLER